MKLALDYKYKFSIVCAVYNVAEYLEESLQSFINQDIGFTKNVQVILVDDGSTDGSAIICDKYAKLYPNNIFVFHKENGGVSSARNIGLNMIEGKYYNFCDPDDLLTTNTLSSVWNFFEKHENETDVTTIPLEFFEAYTGVPYHNSKFEQGTRVIDLKKETYAPLFSSSSSFIHSRVKELFKFDTRLSYSEDAKYINYILLQKCTLGVVTECKYMYRRRALGTSAINSSQRDDRWYFDTLKYFFLETIEYAKEIGNGISAKFLQQTLLSDLKWRLIQKERENKYIVNSDTDSLEKYLALLTKILCEIEPDVIISNPFYDDILKLHVLRSIQKKELSVKAEHGNEYIAYDDCKICDLSTLCSAELCLFEPKKDLTADLYFSVIRSPETSELSFVLDVNGDLKTPKKLAIKDDHTILGVASHTKEYFKVNFPFGKLPTIFSLKYVNRESGKSFPIQASVTGKFFPLSTVALSYFSFGKYVLKKGADTTFSISLASKPRKAFYELRYDLKLIELEKITGCKTVLYRWYYFLSKLFASKKRWLIMDRINKADDNGEAFFSYIRKNKVRGTSAHFAINRGKDFERIKKELGHVVEYNTKRFYLKYISSDALISSHADDFILQPMGKKQLYNKDITCKKKIIFLQHGITQNDISAYLNKLSKNITGLVTASPIEAKIFSRAEFCYENENIWMTGFSRFDRLYDDNAKAVTIMPTWRSYLATGMNSATGIWGLVDSFEESSFFKFYSALLNDERLLSAARKYGYKIRFMLHPIFLPYVNKFKCNEDIECLGSESSYRDIYAKSSLILTDYSSAALDFAYLRKPIIYAQFDRDEFIAKGLTYKLDTDFYDKNALGEICLDYDSTITALLEYMSNGCQLKEQYRQRIDNFFAYSDKSNSKRILDKLEEAGLCKKPKY